MSRKKVVTNFLGNGLQGRRTILGEYEWMLIKGAVDACRDYEYDEEQGEILKSYDLWDNFNDCVDDDAVHTLYMENT